MNQTLQQIKVSIARLPFSKVAGAYNKYCPAPKAGITKVGASKWLADQVSEGAITIQNIMDSEPSTFTI